MAPPTRHRHAPRRGAAAGPLLAAVTASSLVALLQVLAPPPGAGDGPPEPRDLGRFNHTQKGRDRHVFRVPSLRNVELTSPHLHDGSAATLEDAVRVLLERQPGVQVIEEGEVGDIAAFLKSLTGRVPGGANERR